MSAERERSVSAAFVSIADSLVDNYDVLNMLEGLAGDCARLLAVESVGVLLADADGVLQVAGASSPRMRLMALYQVQCRQGPCLDAYRSSAAVLVPDLGQETARWPDFATVAVEAGYASVHTVPLRLRGKVLGTLGLFGIVPGALDEADLDLAEAFAHAASIALTARRATADAAEVNAQLQTALNSRVVLEQAKGILAQHGDLDMDNAFAVLRRYARDHNLRLSGVAAALVAREVPPGQVLEHGRTKTVTTPRRGGR